MRKIKTLLLIVAALLVTGFVSAQTDVRIHGTIKGLNGEKVQLMKRNAEIIATGESNGDNYELKVNMEIGDGRYYMLYVPSVGERGDLMHYPYVFFMTDAADLEINGEIVSEVWQGEDLERRKIDKAEVIGSKMYDEVKKWQNSSPFDEEFSKEVDIYNKLFFICNYEEGGMTDENMKLLQEAYNKISELFKKRNNYMIENIVNYSKNIGYAGMMNESHLNSPVEVLEKIYNMFDPSIRNVGALVDMKARIDLLRSSEVGQTAPDFTLEALDGSKVSLSSFRGKYVLIDFWASWCGPCIKEMPHVIAIYEKYKDNGKLQVISVSTDDNEKKWRDKVVELGLDSKYLQLWDSKDETMKTYNYQGIPFLVFIAPDGTILERDLRGQKLIDTVDKYMGQ